MHQADGQIERSRGLQCPLALQGAHVVDQAGARCCRRPHDLGRAGVHRNDCTYFARERFDTGNDTVELFLSGDSPRTRARGFAADVQYRRTVIDHALTASNDMVEQRFPASKEFAAVGKGVGGDIHHPHDFY